MPSPTVSLGRLLAPLLLSRSQRGCLCRRERRFSTSRRQPPTPPASGDGSGCPEAAAAATEQQVSHEFWLQRWQQALPPAAAGAIDADPAAWPRWHRPHVHPFLVRHWPTLQAGLGQQQGKQQEQQDQQQGKQQEQPDQQQGKQDQQQVLVPLCGASLDLAWLADRPGVSSVVGVDLGGEPVFRRLPELRDAPLAAEPCAPGLARLRSGRLRLYAGDLFHPGLRSLEAGQSDLAWDRGALVALNAAERPAYVALVHSLCRPGRHRVLLETTVFPAALHPGPPFCVNHDQVASLYGDLYQVHLLEVFRDEERRLLYNLPELFYCYYLLVAK